MADKAYEVTNLPPGAASHLLYVYVDNSSTDVYTFDVRPHKSNKVGEVTSTKEVKIRAVTCVVVPIAGDGWTQFKTRFEIEVVNPGSSMVDYTLYMNHS